jgi:hypothetical protein
MVKTAKSYDFFIEQFWSQAGFKSLQEAEAMCPEYLTQEIMESYSRQWAGADKIPKKTNTKTRLKIPKEEYQALCFKVLPNLLINNIKVAVARRTGVRVKGKEKPKSSKILSHLFPIISTERLTFECYTVSLMFLCTCVFVITV